MFTINDDMSIYVTRGDKLFFTVKAADGGKPYVFQPGDIVRIKVYGKKDAENVVLQKDFPVMTATEGVEIYLTEDDTKIGDVISKPVDYWYEVELNPYDNPQTIIGYDEDGAKIFRLLPEGRDVKENEPNIKPEDIPIVDKVLDMTSLRPVQNQAIARAITRLEAAVQNSQTANVNLAAEVGVERARLDNLVAAAVAPVSGDAGYLEVADIRVGADGETYGSAGTALREQIKNIRKAVTKTNLYSNTKYTLPDDDGDAVAESIGFVDTTGAFVSTDTWRATDFIDISHAAIIHCNLMGFNTMRSVAFYGENKEYLSGISVAENFERITGSLDIPYNAKFARFSFLTEQTDQYVRIETIIGCAEMVDNPLHERAITATGDSITASSASDPEWNYVKQIADKQSMTYENKAVWGGVFPKGVVSDGVALPSILETIDTMSGDADFVILSGGINDYCYMDNGTEFFGEISGGYEAELDESTFCGAFESLLKKAILKWQGKKILFVIEHKMVSNLSLTGKKIEEQFLPATIEMLEKWGVPYVNLYNSVPPLGIMPEFRDKYTWDADNDGIGDGWHPNKEGYKLFYMPMVEAKLKSI